MGGPVKHRPIRAFAVMRRIVYTLCMRFARPIWLTFVVMFSAIILTAQSPFAPRSFARLVDFRGSVRIDGTPADVGQAIEFGGVVQTGAAAWAVVELGPTDLVQMEPGTVVHFEFSDTVQRLHLRTGRIAVVSAGISREAGMRGRFVAHTPIVPVTVRSELFFAATEQPDGLFVGLCNGVIQPSNTPPLESSGYQAVRLRSTTGNSLNATPDQSPSWAQDAWVGLERRAGVLLVCGRQ